MRRVALAFLLLASCSEDAPSVADAAYDAPITDGGAPDTSTALTVDFTVAGCPNLDPSVPRCTGKAPLTLEFVAVTSPNVARYIWKLNDGLDPSNAASVTHTYQAPGTYTVSLTGVEATSSLATATKQHAGFVVVLPSAAGEPCDSDRQCAAGTCLCSSSRPCAAGPSAGLCAAECTTSSCAEGEVCADLGVAVASSGRAEPWQTQLCLHACATDRDCPQPLQCRSLPGPQGSAWVKGCFSDVPADMSSSCRDARDVRRNEFCSTGLCADLGALGMCSADCTLTGCPRGSDCAVFGDGRQLCLVPCSLSFDCSADPLLACTPPGTSPLGYQLKNNSSPTGTTHCAPKMCAADKDCAPAGTCQLASGTGRCIQRN